MRLKYIRLAGFKSFVDNTKVAFPEQMTCIVGPNGCGKSNVIDAVRWVLGESSAKNLRGDAMTDVIFNGSQSRKPVGQASVELVFDNEDGRLQGEFSGYQEVSVKRVVTREAQSLYYLNNSKCRRRDITDLFLGTGLGPRSYAIIEQGMISRLIESKPQELRVFIEEAAGISKYKERRKETESRISRTRENLERLTDVREELGQQLAKLQRQAAAAKRYQTLKAEERAFKSQLQALKWLHYQQQCDRVEKELQSEETELEKWLAEQRGSERGQTEFRQKELDLQEQVDQVQEKFYQASSQVTSTEQQIRHQRQISQQRQQQKEQVSQQIQYTQEELNSEKELVDNMVYATTEAEEILTERREIHEEYVLQREQADEKLQLWNEKWLSLQNEIRALEQKNSLIDAEINASSQMLQQHQSRQNRVATELEQLEQNAPASADSIQAEADRLHAEQTQLESEVQNKKQQNFELRDDLAKLREEIYQAQQEVNQLQGQKSSFEQLLASKNVEINDRSQQWLASQQHMGTLRENITVPEQWKCAVELWCGELLSAHVLKGSAQSFPHELNCPVLWEHTPGTLQPGDNEQHALASHLGGPMRHSSLFQGLAAAETFEEAQRFLSDGQWVAVALPSGHIVARDWTLSWDEAADSVLAWQASLERTNGQLSSALEHHKHLQSTLDVKEQEKQQLEEHIETEQNILVDVQRQATEAKERCNYALTEITKHQQQTEKLQAEVHELHELIVELEFTLEEKRSQFMVNEDTLTELKPQLTQEEAAGEQLKVTVANATRSVSETQQQLHDAQLQLQQKNSQKEHSEKHIQRLEKTLADLKEKELESEVTEDTDVEIQILEEQLAEHLLNRESAESELVEIKEQLSEIQEELSVLNKGQSAVHERIAIQREKVESRKMELAASRERGHALLDGFKEEHISLKEVLENMPEDANESEWQKALDDRTRRIQQLGAINLAAIEEVESQAERKEYLDNQYEDLSSSLETLEDAIKKIDRETRSRFKKTYDQVNTDLQVLFPKVFGGGSAYLDLTEDDLLETGVTIMARPPGKKNSTIHLLSGGEKALTALALVFAIFRLNPAPFCLLDEVDAPLDDVNVGRFCRLVKEMSESVQFIYISHNKIAMEMATHLAGVTMQEPGVSRLVAVDVDEAIALAEAS